MAEVWALWADLAAPRCLRKRVTSNERDTGDPPVRRTDPRAAFLELQDANRQQNPAADLQYL